MAGYNYGNSSARIVRTNVKPLVQGNIDIFNRPKVKSDDGYATVRSMSFQDNDGREVLIPTVIPTDDGKWKIASNEESIRHYFKTGQHLGIFSTPEEAAEYGQALHEQQEAFYSRDPAQQQTETMSIAKQKKEGDRIMAGYNNDPNAVRYNQHSLLPDLVIVPNESREQAKALPGQILNEYGLPALQWAGGQLAQNAAITGLTGKSLADWLVYGGNRALNNPKVLSGIAAIGATRFGTPVINGVKFFANSPAGEKVGEVAKKAINWIF